MLPNLKKVFRTDLEKLKTEIQQYSLEKNIWVIDKAIANSGGNLCLHLVGNLNTYIGAQLGNSGYIRNRPLEFSLKDVPRSELIRKIENTIIVVESTLDSLHDKDLSKPHPFRVFEEETSIEFLLLHLSAHLAYHVGQINYHRRLLDNNNA